MKLAKEVEDKLAAAEKAKGKVHVEHTVGEKKGKKERLDPEEARTLMGRGYAKLADDQDSIDDEPDDETKKAVDALTQTVQKSIQESEARLMQKAVDLVNKAYAGQTITVGADLSLEDPTSGFKNVGDFAMAVKKHDQGQPDERVSKMQKVQKADGMWEGDLASGGALVPVQYANELYRDVLADSILFDKARKYPINLGNSLWIPYRTMTTLGQTAQGGGSLGSWLNADGVAITPAKPAYARVQMNLNRWGSMLPVTDELLQDNNVALSNFILQEGGLALAWDLNNACINGTGTGQPTGILNLTSLVVAAADASQTAFTISYTNLVNMKARLWTMKNGNRKNVMWLAHPDCEAQFEQLKDSAGRNLYYATGTIQQAPQAKLFGIPIEFSYNCAGLGSTGDILLVDMDQYFVSTKVNAAVETAMSIHLYFDAAEVAYRMIYRVDAKAPRPLPLNVPGSTLTRSGFVALAPRGGIS